MGNLVTTSTNLPSLFSFVFLFLVLVDVFKDLHFSLNRQLKKM